jgi:hypothetical protein
VEVQASPSLQGAPDLTGEPVGVTGSERVRLAALAREVAMRVPGVVGTDPGAAGFYVTMAGQQRLEGVRCVASARGGYEVSLRLVCALVPLPALAAAVRSRVLTTASRAGLPVRAVSVHIAGVAGPES